MKCQPRFAQCANQLSALRSWPDCATLLARLTMYFAMAILLLNTSALAADRCATHVARLVSLQGDVTVWTPQAGSWQVAQRDVSLCAQDRLRVGSDSRAALLLTNETTVRLNQKTTVTINALSAQPRSLIDLLQGVIHVITRTPTPFQIHTPFVNANIEGTEFVVAVTDAATTISVVEGRVVADNLYGQIVLTNGEVGTALPGRAPTKNLLIRPLDAVQWALYYPTIFDSHLYLQEAVIASVASPDQKDPRPAAAALYRQGNITEAVAILDAAAAQWQSALPANWLTFRAGLLLAVGRLDSALQNIDQALQIDPDNRDAHALKTIIAVTQNDKAAARMSAAKATAPSLSSSPSAQSSSASLATAWLARSYAEQTNFKIDDALNSTQQATRLAPQNALAWARQAELELSIGNQKNALEAASRASRLDPDLSKIQSVLGFSYLTGMQTTAAKTAFAKAIALDQSDPLPRLGLGLVTIRAGDLAAGRTEIAIAASLDPADPLIRSYLGKAHFEEKRDGLAATQFGLAKMLDPLDPTPWFYDALRKQTEDRPVDALADLQQSIALNQQRAVYRSQFLLDADRASRQTSLAKIYDELALHRFAVTEATQSLTTEPANYSGHRFLSDAYARLDRHEIASVSELLQAQLLQPLNLNPLQPKMAFSNVTTPGFSGPVTPSLHEFNSLFERNGTRFSASGLAGNQNTVSAEAMLTGLHDQLSYSAGGFTYRSDGFRINNDIRHNIVGAFVQYAVSPQLNLQVEIRHRQTEHGDIALTFLPGTYSTTYRRALDQTTSRIGAHWSGGTGLGGAAAADTLLSVIHTSADERQRFDSDGLASVRSRDQGTQIEAQQLLRYDRMNLVAGAGHYQFDVRETVFGIDNQFKRTRSNAYGYAHLRPSDQLIWTVGASVDRYGEADFRQQKINPKFGVQWQPNAQWRLRAASFQTVKPALYVQQTIEPTEVAGFNQFFDDGNGARARRDAFAIDLKASPTIDLQLEASQRRLSLPILSENMQTSSEAQREKALRVSAGWRISSRWAINGEARTEDFKRQTEFLFGPSHIRTDTATLGLRYFNPTGMFARVTGTAVRQQVDSMNGSGAGTGAGAGTDINAVHFALLDAALGMRLPDRMGTVTLEAKNLLDKKFRYQDANFRTPAQQSPPFVPARSVVLQITTAF